MKATLPELLAPAGNLEILKKAAYSGADAIYFGGEFFGARAYAGNLNHDEILSAIRFLHLNKKKAYLTVNTLLKTREIESRLFSFLKDFYEEGLDAVLVQDMGVLSFVKDNFPNLPIHISTQCAVTSEYGCRFFKELGAERVVLSRELSLDEIKDITERSGIETEVFVHGALCVSYSGRCMMSSMIGGRSANRGRCAGACRNPYSVTIDGERVEKLEPYPLSMRDLSGLPDLKRLINTRVSSLKVEGRMKDSAYVTGVVSLYRKYLDILGENPDIDYTIASDDLSKLFSLGNRGFFTDCWYFKKNDPSMINPDDSSFKREIKEDTSFDEKGIPVDVSLKAVLGEPLFLSMKALGQEVTVKGKECLPAEKKPTDKKMLEEKLSQLDTKNTFFEAGEISVSLPENEAVFIPMSVLKEMKREATALLTKSLISRREPVSYEASKKKGAALKKRTAQKETETFVSVTTIGQLKVLSERKESFSILIPAQLLSAAKKCGKPIILIFPPVVRKHALKKLDELMSLYYENSFDGILVSGYDALQFLLEKDIPKEKIYLSSDIYVMNEDAKSFLESLSIKNLSIPAEINEGELRHRDNEGDLMTVYGRYDLMTSANCIYKNAFSCEEKVPEKTEHEITLTDRKGASFPVIKDCLSCVNVIKNSVPACLFAELSDLKEIGVDRFLLSFSTEDEKTVDEIMDDYFSSLSGDIKKPSFPVTRGHYLRGVE